MPHSYNKREGHKNFTTGCIKKTEQGRGDGEKLWWGYSFKMPTGEREGVELTLVTNWQISRSADQQIKVRNWQISALPIRLALRSEAQPGRAYLGLSTNQSSNHITKVYN